MHSKSSEVSELEDLLEDALYELSEIEFDVVVKNVGQGLHSTVSVSSKEYERLNTETEMGRGSLNLLSGNKH